MTSVRNSLVRSSFVLEPTIKGRAADNELIEESK